MSFWLDVHETIVILVGPIFWPGLAVGGALTIFYAIVEIYFSEVR